MARVGDLRKMGQLAERLNELASVPSRAARGVASRLNGVLEAQFEQGVDPYGEPWESLAPRTLAKHDEPPLQGEFGDRPGDMAEGTYAKPSRGAGVEINVPFPGSIHQTGASSGNWRMPARRILPQGAMPPLWKEALDEGTAEAFAKATGKR